jgi:hypothetical protein
MPKGQQKGNREAKKPKATKKPPAAAASSFLHPSSATPAKGAKK